MTQTRSDYDNPWKEVLERYFPEFLALFFPQAHADINWNHEHEFLDKELQQVVRDAELGARRADKDWGVNNLRISSGNEIASSLRSSQ